MAAGGKRAGAGRKPGSKTGRALIDVAAQVLQEIDQVGKWKALLTSGDTKVTADVMKYLTDRVHGKPAQQLQLQGDKDKPLEVVIRVLGGN